MTDKRDKLSTKEEMDYPNIKIPIEGFEELNKQIYEIAEKVSLRVFDIIDESI